MSRKITLLFCLLGLAFISQAYGAQNCLISYANGSSSEPECETFIDDDGTEAQRCTESGPGLSQTMLWNSSPRLIQEELTLGELELEGNCDCTLTLYSKGDLTGCRVKQSIVTSTEKTVDASELWTRSGKSLSFAIDCNF